jgi:hypothetical protein
MRHSAADDVMPTETYILDAGIPGSQVMTSIITEILNDSPICCQIVEFLKCNAGAMDSAKGIASWWVRCDESAAQAAVDKLVACGIVSAHTLASGPIYGLSRNPEIREWLQIGSISRRVSTSAVFPKIGTCPQNGTVIMVADPRND